MRRLYITLVVLLLLISGMSYLYFSNLNTTTNNSDLSLKIASHNAGIIFCLQNNKSVIEILKGQQLFNRLIGEDKVVLMDDLKNQLLTKSRLKELFNEQNIYISILPGNNKTIDFLVSVQLNASTDHKSILQVLQENQINVKPLNSIFSIALSERSTVYMGVKKNVLLLSTAPGHIEDALNASPTKPESEFIAFILKNDRLAKNSLANLYINYNQIPSLFKSITPYIHTAEFAVLNNQDAFSQLSYNFSKEKIFFSGETQLNSPDGYYALFKNFKPEKIDVDKILPDNTANYTVYCMNKYPDWHQSLNNWFKTQHQDKEIQKKIKAINSDYHLNLENTFPRYVGSQFITFQLKNKEKLAAITLTNGDKLSQLLLDLSEDVSGDVKRLKAPDVLFYYFGTPFKKFKTPYYVILNNRMFIANSAQALSSFLNKYTQNQLLITQPAYIQLFEQLPNTASILFYFNNKQSQELVINTVFPKYYPHYRDPEGLKNFDSFIFQLSGDKESFQTNLMLNTYQKTPKQDTIGITQMP